MSDKKTRPSEHIKAQKQVKEIENYQCMICGIEIKDKREAHGHHLIYYKDGGAGDVQNMTTLCASCHRKYHNGELNVDIYRL